MLVFFLLLFLLSSPSSDGNGRLVAVCEAGPALSLLGHSTQMQTALPAKWVIAGPARGPELAVVTIPDIEWRTLK